MAVTQQSVYPQLIGEIVRQNLPVTITVKKRDISVKISGVVSEDIKLKILYQSPKIELTPDNKQDIDQFLDFASSMKEFVISIDLEKLEIQALAPCIAKIAEKFPDLRSLSLKTKEPLSCLSKLKNLKTLFLTGSDQEEINLCCLEILSEFRLHHYKNIKTLPGLSPFKQLKILEIVDCVLLNSISYLNELTNLTSLHLESCSMEGKLELKNLEKLERVNISTCVNTTALSLIQLKNLKKFTLSACSNLRNFTITSANETKDFEFDKTVFVVITKMNNIFYTQPAFFDCVKKITSINDRFITFFDFSFNENLEEVVFNGSPCLETLVFTGSKVRSVTIKSIHTLKTVEFKQCKKLKELNISDITVPDNFQVDLTDCSGLEKVHINTASLVGKIKFPSHLDPAKGLENGCVIS